MYRVNWKQISSRGRVVCKRKAFKSGSALETFVDQLIQKDGFLEITGYHCGRRAA